MLNIFIGNNSEIYQLFSVSRFFLNDFKKNNKTTFFLQPIIKDQSSWRKKGYICFSDTLTLNKAVSNIGCSIHTVELLFFAGGLFSRISRVFENPRKWEKLPNSIIIVEKMRQSRTFDPANGRPRKKAVLKSIWFRPMPMYTKRPSTFQMMTNLAFFNILWHVFGQEVRLMTWTLMRYRGYHESAVACAECSVHNYCLH